MSKRRKKPNQADTIEPEVSPDVADDEVRISIDDAGPDLEAVDLSAFVDDEDEDETDTPPSDDLEINEVLAELEAERDEAIEGRQRALADFANFQRRARENEARANRDGVTAVVRSLLPVLDQLDLALSHDPEQITVEQFLEGVQMVRAELGKALEGHVVSVINPAIGSEFDPIQHHAVARKPSDEHPADAVVAVFQVGYLIRNEFVLRPATVAISSGEEG